MLRKRALRMHSSNDEKQPIEKITVGDICERAA
jgi:hypothetical protein